MESDIFRAGVRPGGPTSHDEIKMLICYILAKLERKLGFAQIHEALEENHLVNYFELVQAVDGLVKTGHLVVSREEEVEEYAVTDLGALAGREFAAALPLAVRHKAVASAHRLLRREKRAAEVSVRITQEAVGFTMELSIPQEGGKLVGFTLFLPTQEECDLVRRRFLNDPLYIYRGVLALLSGDKEVVGEMFPQGDSLF